MTISILVRITSCYSCSDESIFPACGGMLKYEFIWIYSNANLLQCICSLLGSLAIDRNNQDTFSSIIDPSVRFRVFLKLLVVLWFWKICVLMYFNTYTPFFKVSCLFFFNQPNFTELSKHLATYGLASAFKCNIIKLQTKWYASHLRTGGDNDSSQLWEEVWSKFAI